jgi:hypothetical protein
MNQNFLITITKKLKNKFFWFIGIEGSACNGHKHQAWKMDFKKFIYRSYPEYGHLIIGKSLYYSEK